MADPAAGPDRLVLGTAQLGMPYGIANRTGQPPFPVAREIVREAWQRGIREFDTAQAYGKSERILGRALTDLGVLPQARLISKLNPKLDHLSAPALEKAVLGTLENLGIPGLHGLLLHSENALDLLNGGLSPILSGFLAKGYAKHIGISIYSPERGLQALSHGILEIIQVPTNMLDRRFLDSGFFERAAASGRKVYVRSVFLQGLILMSPEELPGAMAEAQTAVKKIETLSTHFKISNRAMALNYVREKVPGAKIIFGAETPEQVTQNSLAWGTPIAPLLLKEIDRLLPALEDRLLNPALWPK